MAAILDLRKLGMMKGSNDEMIVINVFVTPENISVECVDTKMKFIRGSDDEIEVKIDSNGGHFGFMQIRYDERM